MLFFSLTNNLLYFLVTENLIHSNGFEWPLMFFGCVTGNTWHRTCDTWLLTPHISHLTCDTWHLTCDTWHMDFSLLFLQFFGRFCYVSATNQTGWEIQCLPYAGLLLLREGCKKKPLNRRACSYLPQTPPPPTLTALGYHLSAPFWIIWDVRYAVKLILYDFGLNLSKTRQNKGTTNSTNLRWEAWSRWSHKWETIWNIVLLGVSKKSVLGLPWAKQIDLEHEEKKT